MKRFRFQPTYSNVVATMALFFALAGGAWAATQLPKESVGSAQLKNGAVTPGKLSAAAKSGMTGARGEAGPQGALGPRGNEGPRGESGSDGATGPQGVRGATGATGAKGDRGEPGEPGERGITGQTGSTGLQGPTGAKGERGEQGEIGMRGERGLTGQTGAPGEPGSEGPRGPEGQRGPEGPEGKQGQEGAEGKQGPEGAEGKQGPEGQQGDEGKEGPAGPSDAYVATSGPAEFSIVHEPEPPNNPLLINEIPAGEYVIQAALTVQGASGQSVVKCWFGAVGDGVMFDSLQPFETSVAFGHFASMTGMTSATISEPSTVYVSCETAPAGTEAVITGGGGHLTVTKVGALHRGF